MTNSTTLLRTLITYGLVLPLAIFLGYHSGPLSTIIPFGIWGVIGLVWLWVAGGRALLANHRYGDPSLRAVNCFLLSLFLARIVLYLIVYGGFYGDMLHFAGILALSIALNGGVQKPAPVAAPASTPATIKFKRPVRTLATGVTG